MALVTGSPAGTQQAAEDLYLEGAPNIYFQDYEAGPWFAPDTDGFYWNMTGSSTYPVFEVGCPVDVSVVEDITVNDVLCDNVGVKDTIQQRNSVSFNFSIKSLFPYQTLRHLLKYGVVTETAPTQKMGIGPISATQFWQVYAPKVYDVDNADYIWIYLAKAKFVEAPTIEMPFGDAWMISGLQLRGFADTTKPADQIFGMMGRLDPSVIT